MVVQSALLTARTAWRPSGTGSCPITRGGENPDYAALGAGSEGLPTPLRAADANLFDSSHTEAWIRLCRGRAVLHAAAASFFSPRGLAARCGGTGVAGRAKPGAKGPAIAPSRQTSNRDENPREAARRKGDSRQKERHCQGPHQNADDHSDGDSRSGRQVRFVARAVSETSARSAPRPRTAQPGVDRCKSLSAEMTFGTHVPIRCINDASDIHLNVRVTGRPEALSNVHRRPDTCQRDQKSRTNGEIRPRPALTGG